MSLSPNFPHPIILCLHRLRSVRAGLAEVLQVNSKLKITEPDDKEIIRNNRIYLAPANYHLMFEQGFRFSLSVREPVNHSRPSLDICFETAAEIFKNKAIGVLLSGANMDGAKGMFKIKKEGGLTIVQSPEDCEIRTMPEACINMFQPDHIFDTTKIINFITNL
jgi:two-component system, chemotaxis family, protein-glutamate methylesterase/glutaminase